MGGSEGGKAGLAELDHLDRGGGLHSGRAAGTVEERHLSEDTARPYGADPARPATEPSRLSASTSRVPSTIK